MVQNQETFLTIRRILSSMLKIEEAKIKPESILREQLGADSVDVVDMVVRMEKEFGLEAPDNFNLQIQSVADIVTVVEELKKKHNEIKI